MSMMRSGRCPPLFLGSTAVLGIGVLLVAHPDPAWADDVRPGSTVQLEELSVESTGAPRGVVPAHAGGQVAQGGRVGLLGNTETKKSPFSVTSYAKVRRLRAAAESAKAPEPTPTA